MIDPLIAYPGYGLRRASAISLAGLSARLEPLGLRTTDASVLLMIEANPGATQSEIGPALGIASANLTPLVARLDERGLLSRNPVDGRSQSLMLTKAGVRLAVKARAAMEEHEQTLLEQMPAHTRGAFMEALTALWRRESSNQN